MVRVPKLGRNTSINDNDEWDLQKAMEIMAQYVVKGEFTNIKDSLIPWLTEDHSDIRGLIEYDDDEFDRINKEAFDKLLTHKISDLYYGKLTGKKIMFNTGPSDKAIGELKKQIAYAEIELVDKENKLSEDEVKDLQNLINTLEEQLESVDIKIDSDALLGDVIENKGHGFFRSIDLESGEFDKLIGEVGYVVNRIKGNSLDDFLNVYAKEMAQKSGGEFTQGSIKSLIDRENVANYVKDIKLKQFEKTFYNGMGSRSFDSYHTRPTEISLPLESDDVETIHTFFKEGEGHVFDTTSWDAETWYSILDAVSNELVLELVKESISIWVDENYPKDTEAQAQITDILNRINKITRGVKRDKGDIITSDISLDNTDEAFKRSLENMNLEEWVDRMTLHSDKKNPILEAESKSLEYSLVPEWGVGKSYTSSKVRRKTQKVLKDEIDVNNIQTIKKFKNLAIVGSYKKVMDSLNVRKRVKESTLRLKIENNMQVVISETKQEYEDILEFVQGDKWDDKFDINLDDTTALMDKSVEDIITMFIDMHLTGEHVRFIENVRDEMKEIENFFDNYKEELESRKDGIPREEYKKLKIDEEEEGYIELIESFRMRTSQQLKNRIPPIESDELRDSIVSLIEDMGDNVNDYPEVKQLSDASRDTLTNLRNKIKDRYEELDKEGLFNIKLKGVDVAPLMEDINLVDKLKDLAKDTALADPRNSGSIKIRFQLRFNNVGAKLILEVIYNINTNHKLLLASSGAGVSTKVGGKGKNIPVGGGSRTFTGVAVDGILEQIYKEIRVRLITLKRSVS